jgi:hypothetical protein
VIACAGYRRFKASQIKRIRSIKDFVNQCYILARVVELIVGENLKSDAKTTQIDKKSRNLAGRR